MNYEQKYKDALDAAKHIYDDMKSGGNFGGIEDLEVIFPELRESENEKIRKWLVDYFAGIGKSWIHREFTCEQIVAYLEKQKELPFVKDVVLGLPGLYFYDGERMHFQGSPTVEEKQKEQKPAEWSEEDEKMLNNIQYLLHTFIYGSAETGMAEYKYQKEIDWLKTLSKPTIKWSAEDEKIHNGLVRLLDLLFENDNYLTEVGIDAGVFKRWLKSLRPSWKPSEEQMETLLGAKGVLRNLQYNDWAKILAVLYEQLKQL